MYIDSIFSFLFCVSIQMVFKQPQINEHSINPWFISIVLSDCIIQNDNSHGHRVTFKIGTYLPDHVPTIITTIYAQFLSATIPITQLHSPVTTADVPTWQGITFSTIPRNDALRLQRLYASP